MKNRTKSQNFSCSCALILNVIGEEADINRFLLYRMYEYVALRAEIEVLKADVGDDEVDGLRRVGQ